MANKETSEKRICFYVDTEKKRYLNQILEWGDMKKIYSVLTDQLIDLFENYDPEVVKAGIVSKKIPLTSLIDLNKKEKKDATN